MVKLGATEKLIIYVLSKGRETPTTDLVKLLAGAKRSESAVRASLFRLRQKGILVGSKEGRETFYVLSDLGREVFESFWIKIVMAEEPWEGKWLLFSFNIPERKRNLRNLLREELKQHKFGRLHTNLWISPYDLRSECQRIVRELGVEEYVVMFLTEQVGDDPRELAANAWDLKGLERVYEGFMRKYSEELEELRHKVLSGEMQASPGAFLNVLEMKEELVELFEKEPMLPAELLPKNWIGFKFRELIKEYLQLLYQKAGYGAKFENLMSRKNK